MKQPKISHTHGNVVNIYIVYEINKKNSPTRSDPTLENCLFGAVILTKNVNIDKYGYSGYGIGFDNKKKDILVLGTGPTQGLEHTLTAEKMYSINFTEKNKSFV